MSQTPLEVAIEWSRIYRGGCTCRSCKMRAAIAPMLQHLLELRAACETSPEEIDKVLKAGYEAVRGNS